MSIPRKCILSDPFFAVSCKLLIFQEVGELAAFQRMDIRLHLKISGGVSTYLGPL